MYVQGVSKKHDNNGKRRHYQDKGKHWRLYFYDSDGSFHTKRVSWIQALYWKTKKKHIKKLCNACNKKFVGADKCPNCE